MNCHTEVIFQLECVFFFKCVDVCPGVRGGWERRGREEEGC